MLIPLRRRGGDPIHFAMVDDQDHDWLMAYKWSITSKGYVQTGLGIGGKYVTRLIHRLIVFPGEIVRDCIDPLLERMTVDHEDHNPLNNQRYNLKPATYSENNRNRSKFRGTKNQYTGVDRHHGKWRARIGIDGRMVQLGRFATEAEALAARREAEAKYFGSFAYAD